MRSLRLPRTLLVLALWSLSIPVWGQSNEPPFSPFPVAPTPADEGIRPAASASGTDLNYTSPATLLPELNGHLDSPPAQEWFKQGKLEYTWLPATSHKSLQINDVELTATAAIPLAQGWAPLLISPGVAAHFWDVAAGAGEIRFYDLYAEIGWRPQLAPWLFADLAVTPGVYSDIEEWKLENVQMRGRGLAIVAFSPQLQLVGGALYVNRNKTKILPAGGVIWNPDDDTKLNFVFPQPKLAHRLTTIGDTQWWGYLSGEFGGGRWSFGQGEGPAAFLDYTDVRVLHSVWSSRRLKVGMATSRSVMCSIAR